jgi:hypothetical protein
LRSTINQYHHTYYNITTHIYCNTPGAATGAAREEASSTPGTAAGAVAQTVPAVVPATMAGLDLTSLQPWAAVRVPTRQQQMFTLSGNIATFFRKMENEFYAGMTDMQKIKMIKSNMDEITFEIACHLPIPK